jgi:hypothetical protein
MATLTSKGLSRWAVIGIALVLGAILLWVGPEEQTLGSGIRSVYIHVALTWTAMLGIVAAGLMGFVTLLLSKPAWLGAISTIIWVAIGLFFAGLVMSFIAAGINWGGVFWDEPRTNSAIQILVAALAVQIANRFSLPFRVKGGLYFLLILFMFWSIATIPDVLHPGDAARTSPPAIRFTFFGLFALLSLAAGWFVWQLERRKGQGSKH